MRCSKRSIAVATIIVLSLGIGQFSTRDAALASQTLNSQTFAANAAKAKRQCIRSCRARYHDCLHVEQLPSFQCQGIYQDCTQYSCTGLGPG
jgi:hypothetical protein